MPCALTWDRESLLLFDARKSRTANFRVNVPVQFFPRPARQVPRIFYDNTVNARSYDRKIYTGEFGGDRPAGISRTVDIEIKRMRKQPVS